MLAANALPPVWWIGASRLASRESGIGNPSAPPDLPPPPELLDRAQAAMMAGRYTYSNGRGEPALLAALAAFAEETAPFDIPSVAVEQIGPFFALVPQSPHQPLQQFAARVVESFEPFRAPLSETDIQRRKPDSLPPQQRENLMRWGYPYVFDEFRFHMTLTGPLLARDFPRIEQGLKAHFDPVLAEPVMVTNLALFVETERGAPFTVHSLHPLGQVSSRKIA